MNKYVNIGVLPETRENLRLIARQTNTKKHQIVAEAIADYARKILLHTTKANSRIVRGQK